MVEDSYDLEGIHQGKWGLTPFATGIPELPEYHITHIKHTLFFFYLDKFTQIEAYFSIVY